MTTKEAILHEMNKDLWMIYFYDAGKSPEVYDDKYFAFRRYKSLLVNWNVRLLKTIDTPNTDFNPTPPSESQVKS